MVSIDYMQNFSNNQQHPLTNETFSQIVELNHHATFLSLYRTLVEKRLHTPDIGGTAKTSDVVKSVLEFIAEEMEEHKWRAR
ncbi:hypothetical protein OSTOST_13393 [Ostertagia ostertagi]